MKLMREEVYDIIVREKSLADDLLQTILKQKGMKSTSIPSGQKVHTPLESVNFVGNSPAMQTVVDSIELFSGNDNVVWIVGEKKYW